jgi:hypothetical protein
LSNPSDDRASTPVAKSNFEEVDSLHRSSRSAVIVCLFLILLSKSFRSSEASGPPFSWGIDKINRTSTSVNGSGIFFSKNLFPSVKKEESARKKSAKLFDGTLENFRRQLETAFAKNAK